MRIGKPVEHLQAATKALDIADPIIKLTAFARQIGYAGYLVNDMLAWVRSGSPFFLSTGFPRLGCVA
jgi:peroxin-11B